MDVLEKIIDKLDDNYVVKEAVKGLYWTAIVSKNCGLASTMLQDCKIHDEEEDSYIGNIEGTLAKTIAKFALSNEIKEASWGLAAINSLIEVDEKKCKELNAGDFLLEKAKYKNISIIGHFPFVDSLKRYAKNLWVIEKWPRTGDYSAESAKDFLPQSDVIAISSTTLINKTFEELIKMCPTKSFKLLLGPTTPMDKVLFDYGIDAISGSVVHSVETTLRYIKEGANFRILKRTGSIKLLTMFKNNI